MAAKSPLELVTSMTETKQFNPNAPKGVHVRDWVKKNYPTEFQTDLIKYPFTFEELKKAWDEDPDNDFYKVASQDGSGFDSEVREEIFNGLVENLGGDYDDYYYKWLGKEKPNARILNNQKKLEQAANQAQYESLLKKKYPDRYKAVKSGLFKDLSDEDIDKFARDWGVDLD